MRCNFTSSSNESSEKYRGRIRLFQRAASLVRIGHVLSRSRPFSKSLTTPALSVLSSSSPISSTALRSAFLMSTRRLSNIGGYSIAQSTASRAVHTGNNRYSSSSVRAASASQCTAVCTAFAILFSRTLRALDSNCSTASPDVATRWKWRKNIRNLSFAVRNCALLWRCCTALAESEIRLWWWPRYVRA